jgi:hypothetical protein
MPSDTSSTNPGSSPACARRFRRPKHQYHNHKSEVAARHFAYRRGSAYLERYCLLVALGAYLEAEGLTSATSFEAWLDARPELKQVRSSLLLGWLGCCGGWGRWLFVFACVGQGAVQRCGYIGAWLLRACWLGTLEQ